MAERKKENLTPSQALTRAARYCAYQERCHKEVSDKLNQWGLYDNDAGEVILKLIEQGYLNEERFAKAFAGGKFRTKKWGKRKIMLELKARQISEYCIREAMKEIGGDDYREELMRLLHAKWKHVKEKDPRIKSAKVARHLISKGYEADVVWEALRNLNL